MVRRSRLSSACPIALLVLHGRQGGKRAIDLYRSTYRPASPSRTHARLCFGRWPAKPWSRRNTISHRALCPASTATKGILLPLEAPDIAAAQPSSAHEKIRLEKFRRSLFVGTGRDVVPQGSRLWPWK